METTPTRSTEAAPTRPTERTPKGWNVLDRDAAVLWREYWFGGGLATTLVFRGAGDGLIVISPGKDTGAEALDELRDFGQVVALVANNGFHWLGQPEWRKHFPAARSFAPAGAAARLAKKLPHLGAFEPIESLAPLLGDHAAVVDAPAHRQGNAYATVRSKKGVYFYPSDLLADIPKLPKNPLFRLLMTTTDSAPGYKLFRPAVWLQVGDKEALRAWIDQELTRSRPTVVVPAHGAPVSGSDLLERTRALLAKM
jgi:hypothetical protein